MSNQPSQKVNVSDDEETALATAARCKHDAIAALVLACEARRRRGAETQGIEDSINYEQMTLSGYEKALANRRRELGVTRGRR